MSSVGVHKTWEQIILSLFHLEEIKIPANTPTFPKYDIVDPQIYIAHTPDHYQLLETIDMSGPRLVYSQAACVLLAMVVVPEYSTLLTL